MKKFCQKGSSLAIVAIVLLLAAVAASILLLVKGPRLPNKAAEPTVAPKISAQMLESSAKSQSLQLIKSIKGNPLNPQTINSKDQSEMQKTLQDRKQTMLRLAKENPNAFFKYAFPDKLKQKFPKSLQNLVEQEVETSGTAQVVHGDNFKDKKSQINYYLVDGNNNKLNLSFVNDPSSAFTTGNTVKIKGTKIDNIIVVPPSPQNIASNVQTTSVAAKKNKVTKTIAVILFNFIDDPSTPWTPQQIKSWTFTDPDSVNAYYKKNSYGQVSLVGKKDITGDVFGWVTLNSVKGQSCNESLWSQEATNLLTAKGVDLAGYDHYIYAFPNASCWYSGLAEISGSHLWINGSYEYSHHGVVNHELGHNFSAQHANAYFCHNDNGLQLSLSKTCDSWEYGDPFDVMGDAWSDRELNAYHRTQFGYMSPSNIQDVTLTDGLNQTFSILPLETKTKGVQVLRIPRTKDRSGIISQYYYLDYRQPNGIWDNFSVSDPVVNGVELRLGSTLTPPHNSYFDTHTQLIDTRPQTLSSDWVNFNDSALPVKFHFTDESRGVTIKTLSTSQTGATVTVKYDKPQCVRAKPELTLYPIANWGHAGETLYYYYSIKNNDNYGCTKTSFNLDVTAFSGWKMTGQKTGIEIEPESTFYGNFAMTSTQYTETGYYTITMTVSHPKTALLNSSMNANYNVYPADTVAPTVSIYKPKDGESFRLKDIVSVGATATDNQKMGYVNLIVDGTEQFNGALSGSSDYYLSLDTSKMTPGAHTLAARAYDQEGNNTTSTAIKIFLK